MLGRGRSEEEEKVEGSREEMNRVKNYGKREKKGQEEREERKEWETEELNNGKFIKKGEKKREVKGPSDRGRKSRKER